MLMSRTIGLYDGFVRAKAKYPDLKFAIWNVDVRETIEEWGILTNFIQEVDYYFVVAFGVVERWQRINPNTYFVPQGLQEKRYFPVTPTDIQRQKYECDVSFIGSVSMPEIHKERGGIVQAFQDSRFDFRHLTGVYGEEHSAAVACSKVNLAVTHGPEVSHYISVRDWKILGAGGILLERHHPGLEDLLGGFGNFYHNIGDAINKAGELLVNYEDEKKRAKEASDWVLATQTYAHRVDLIEGILSA